MKGNKN